jgi:hypothetical protein
MAWEGELTEFKDLYEFIEYRCHLYGVMISNNGSFFDMASNLQIRDNVLKCTLRRDAKQKYPRPFTEGEFIHYFEQLKILHINRILRGENIITIEDGVLQKGVFME